MPDVRFGLDTSGAEGKANALASSLRSVAEQAQRAQTALAGLSGGPGALQQAQALNQLAQAERNAAEAARARQRVQIDLEQHQQRLAINAAKEADRVRKEAATAENAARRKAAAESRAADSNLKEIERVARASQAAANKRQRDAQRQADADKRAADAAERNAARQVAAAKRIADAAERATQRKLNATLTLLSQRGGADAGYANQIRDTQLLARSQGVLLNTQSLLAAAQARLTASIAAQNTTVTSATVRWAALRAALAATPSILTRISAASTVVRRQFTALATQAHATATRIQTAFDNARRSVDQRFGRTLTRTLTLPFVLATGAAIKAELDFRRTFTTIRTLAEESAAGAEVLKKEVLALGPAVGIGPNELARALYSIESVGYQGAEALDILQKSAEAAAIGLGDTQDIAKTVVAAMRAWSQAGLTAQEATDQLITAVQLGGAEADAFAGTLGRVIGIAKEAGATFAQTTAFLATFTRFGVPASEAVTSLRQALTLFVRVPTKQTEEALDKLNLTVEKARELLAERGLAGAFIEVVRRAQSLSGNIVGQLFPNIRALAGILANASSQAEDYYDIEQKITNSTGKLASAFAITANSGVLVYRQLKAAAEAASILLVEQTGLAAVATGLARELTTLFRAFSALSPSAKALVGTFVAFAGVIGPLTLTLGILARVVGALLVPAFGGLAAVVGTAGAIAVGLGALKFGSNALSSAWKELTGVVENLTAFQTAGTDLKKIESAALDAAEGVRKFALACTDLLIIAGILIGGAAAGGNPLGFVVGGVLGAIAAHFARIALAAPDAATAIRNFNEDMETLRQQAPPIFGVVRGPVDTAQISGLVQEQRRIVDASLATLQAEEEKLANLRANPPTKLIPGRNPKLVVDQKQITDQEDLVIRLTDTYARAEAQLREFLALESEWQRYGEITKNVLTAQLDETERLSARYAEWSQDTKVAIADAKALLAAEKEGAEAVREYTHALEVEKLVRDAVKTASKDDLTPEQLEAIAAHARILGEELVTAKDKLDDFYKRQENEQLIGDLELTLSLTRREIEATEQGKEALRAFNVEKAVELKYRELILDNQKEAGAHSEQEIADIIELTRLQAEATEQLKEVQRTQKDIKKDADKAAKDYAKIWENTVEDIQRTFADMFRDVLANGKDAFKNFGDYLKDLFLNIAGQIAQTLVFAPILQQVQGIGTGRSGLGKFLNTPLSGVFSGGGGASGQSQIQAQNAVSSLGSSVTGGFKDVLGSIFGGGSTGQPQKSILVSPGPSAASSGITWSSVLSGGGSALNLDAEAAFEDAVASFQSAVSTPLFSEAAGGASEIAQAAAGFTSSNAAVAKTVTTATGNLFGAVGTVGDALGSVAAGVTGILAGVQIVKGLKTDYAIEKISARVGGYVGGLVGAVVGAYFGGSAGAGLGGLLGAIGGGALLRGAGGIVGAATHGRKLFETSSRSQQFDRSIVLGADPITALILAFAIRNKPDIGLGLGTASSAAALEARGLQLGPGGIQQSPFGFVGALGAFTGGDLGNKSITNATKYLVSIDKQIARLLNISDRELILQTQLPDILTANTNNLSGKIAQQRIATVLGALGFPSETIATIDQSLEAGLETASTLLNLRKEIKDLVDGLKGVVVVAPNATAAFQEIEDALSRIEFEGPIVGIIEDLDALRETARQNLIIGFNTVVQDAIAALIAPADLAISNLLLSQQQRVDEATKLGADLVQVERLNTLERINLLKQLNQPIQSALDQIRSSATGSSPRQAISFAEQRFFDIALGLQQQTGEFQTQDLVTAAQTLLQLGEQFLGAPTFAQQREDILGVLESFLVDITPSDEQLTNLNLELARGNAISEQQLGQLIDQTVSMRGEITLLRAQLERLLAA